MGSSVSAPSIPSSSGEDLEMAYRLMWCIRGTTTYLRPQFVPCSDEKLVGLCKRAGDFGFYRRSSGPVVPVSGPKQNNETWGATQLKTAQHTPYSTEQDTLGIALGCLRGWLNIGFYFFCSPTSPSHTVLRLSQRDTPLWVWSSQHTRLLRPSLSQVRSSALCLSLLPLQLHSVCFGRI